MWVMLIAVLLVGPVLAQREPAGAPRCRHHRCKYLGYNQTGNKYWDDYYYEIEGNPIRLRYHAQQSPGLTMECHGARVLESPGLPHAEPSLHVRALTLENCPPPAKGSLQITFATLNLLICKQDNLNTQCELELSNQPAMPALTAKYFSGLEHVQSLTINAKTVASPERGFLNPLWGLQTLKINKVQLPTGELDTLPPSLETLSITQTGMERLPEAVYSSTKLRELTIVDDVPFDAVAVPLGMSQLVLVTPATTLKLDAAPTLRILELRYWVEPLPVPMTRCDVLVEMYLTAPAMRALPDGWLAKCPRLDTLRIVEAYNLTTLPPTLFTPNSKLKRLIFSQGALETIPAKLLHQVRGIQTLELNNNHLQILAGNFFEYFYGLTKLQLSSNNFNGSVIDAVALTIWGSQPVLWRLIELDLSHNPGIGDVCGADGYSPLSNMGLLQKLALSNTGVSRICRDWRENMPELKKLDLSNTNVSKLSFEDLQYKRTVQAQVLLGGAPVASVRITRENYNKAVRAPPSFTTVVTDAELQCDCSMYWARRALEHPVAQHTLPGLRELRCIGGRFLRDVPAEELVCGAREECAAAALPAECACAARPDDNPAHDRWLVRAHCGNSSLALVPRRIHPFYPINKFKNQAAYLTHSIISSNYL